MGMEFTDEDLPVSFQGFLSLEFISFERNKLRSVPQLNGLVNLTSVNLESNHIQVVQALPEGLRTLIMNFNEISLIVNLPSTLQVAEFRSNMLQSLPVLPPNLKVLKVGRNSLQSLPSLPDSLQYLSCYGNNLSALPGIPRSLEVLYASVNPLNSLPVSLANATELRELEVASCNLTAIPAFMKDMTKLRYLQASGNGLPAVPPLFSGPESKVERLLLAGNNISRPVERVLNTISESYPSITELDLSSNPLGGSLSFVSILDISITFNDYGLILPSLRFISLRDVKMTGAVFFDLFKVLWPVVEVVDFRDNPGLTTFPLRQEQSLISIDVRGCSMGPFLRNATSAGSFVIDKYTYTIFNHTTIGMAPVSRYVLDPLKGDVACPETLEAGLIRRFNVIVDPSGSGYSSALGCRCQKGTFGVPDVDMDAGCTECSGIFNQGFKGRSASTNYSCDDGSRVVAYGVWPYVIQTPVIDWGAHLAGGIGADRIGSPSSPDTTAATDAPSSAADCPFKWPGYRAESEWKLGMVPCPHDSDASPCLSTEVKRAPPRLKVCHNEASFMEEVRRYSEAFKVNCAVGHEGRFCSRCAEGFYKSGRSCARCTVGIGLTSLFVSLLAFVGFCIRLLLRINTRSSGISRIFIMHLQLLGSLVSVINIEIPAGARIMISSLDWVTGLSFSGVECLAARALGGPLTSAREFAPFIASIAMPVVAVVVAAISVYTHFCLVWGLRAAADLYHTWRGGKGSGVGVEGVSAGDAQDSSGTAFDLGPPAIQAAAPRTRASGLTSATTVAAPAAAASAVLASPSNPRTHPAPHGRASPLLPTNPSGSPTREWASSSPGVPGHPALRTISGMPPVVNQRRFSLHPVIFGKVQREAAISMVVNEAPSGGVAFGSASPMLSSVVADGGRRRTNSDSAFLRRAGMGSGQAVVVNGSPSPRLGADGSPLSSNPILGRRGAAPTIVFRTQRAGGSADSGDSEMNTSFKDRIVLCFTYIWLVASFRALRKISSAFGCTDYGTGSPSITYLSDHLWVECSWSRNSAYRTLVVSAGAMLVLYIIITLALLIVIFGRKEVPETHRTTLIIRRLLEGPYRFGRMTKSWECMQLGRRFAFALFHGLSPYDSPILPLGISSVLLVSISLHLWFRPFKSVVANTIEMASMTMLLASYATWQVISLGTLSFSNGTIGFALLVANVAFLVIVFVVLFILYRVSLRKSHAAVTYFTSERSETMSATWDDDRFLSILSPLAQPTDVINPPLPSKRASTTSKQELPPPTSSREMPPSPPISPKFTAEPGHSRGSQALHFAPKWANGPSVVTFQTPTPSPRNFEPGSTPTPTPPSSARSRGEDDIAALPALLPMEDAPVFESGSEAEIEVILARDSIELPPLIDLQNENK